MASRQVRSSAVSRQRASRSAAHWRRRRRRRRRCRRKQGRNSRGHAAPSRCCVHKMGKGVIFSARADVTLRADSRRKGTPENGTICLTLLVLEKRDSSLIRLRCTARDWQTNLRPGCWPDGGNRWPISEPPTNGSSHAVRTLVGYLGGSARYPTSQWYSYLRFDAAPSLPPTCCSTSSH